MININKNERLVIHKKLAVFVLVGIIIIVLSLVNKSFYQRLTFANFPQLRFGEMSLLSEFDINSKQFNELSLKQVFNIENKRYRLTEVQYLNDYLTSYKLEVTDKNKDGQLDAFPLTKGLILVDKNMHKAIQLYDTYIGLYEDGLFDSSALQDINNDGEVELVVQASSGGNSLASSRIYIFQFTNLEINLLNPNFVEDFNLNVSGISDINFDGIYELVVTDDDWEISSCTDHASGPIKYYIYAWSDEGKYVDDSHAYPEFYRKIIDKNISDVCSGNKEFCFGPALEKYFAHKQIGEEREGWNSFLRSTEGVIDSMWPSKACRNYLINLHTKNEKLSAPTLDTKELLNLK